MKKIPPSRKGITLVELMISVSVLSLFLGLVAWLAKGATDMRLKSERALNLMAQLQRNMFRIENDLLSARRHTLGNLLCNNVVVSVPDFGEYRTTSDPGFDFSRTPFTNDTNVRTAWFWQRNALIPMGIGIAATGDADIRVEEGAATRFQGTGSLSIRSSLPDGAFFSLRSPDIDDVTRQSYVLAGWVRGENTAGNTLTPQLAFQRDTGDGLPSNDIVSVNAPAATLNTWTYITVRIPPAHIHPTWKYNVYLRTLRNGNNGATLTAFFDSITVTPVRDLAAINFETSRVATPASPVNLHRRNDLGMVFYITNPSGASDLQEMKYIYSEGDLSHFPATKPDLLRFRGEIPFPSVWGIWWGTAPPNPDPNSDRPPQPFPFLMQAPLLNISQLNVSWVGNWNLGANRSISVSLTVRDQNNPPNTLTLTRTLFPPTD